MPDRVVIRCDFGSRRGMGHLARCRVLADALSATGLEPLFAIGPEGRPERLADFPYAVAGSPAGSGSARHADWLAGLVAEAAVRWLVVDMRDDLPPALLQEIRSRGVAVLVLDDPGERRLAADLAVYPPVPQLDSWSWAGFDGELLRGWDWVLVDPRFAGAAGGQGKVRERPRLLLTMGGSDPAQMTERALAALQPLQDRLQLVLVRGPAFGARPQLDAAVDGWQGDLELVRGGDLARLAAGADLALAAFGVTAYELAAAGLPALYLGLSEDHCAACEALVEAGMAECLGVADQVPAARMTRHVARLLDDADRRRRMAAAGPRFVDGRGAWRLAQRMTGHAQGSSRIA